MSVSTQSNAELCKGMAPGATITDKNGNVIYTCPGAPQAAPQPTVVQQPMQAQTIGGLSGGYDYSLPAYIDPCAGGRCNQNQGYDMNFGDRGRALAQGATPTRFDRYGDMIVASRMNAFMPAAQQQFRTEQANQVMADPETQRNVALGLQQGLTMDEAIGNSLQQSAGKYGYSAYGLRMLPDQAKASQSALSDAAAIAVAAGTPLNARNVQIGPNTVAPAQLRGGLQSWDVNADGGRQLNFGVDTITARTPSEFLSIANAANQGFGQTAAGQTASAQRIVDATTRAKELEAAAALEKFKVNAEMTKAEKEIAANKEVAMNANKLKLLEAQTKALEKGDLTTYQKLKIMMEYEDKGVAYDPVTLMPIKQSAPPASQGAPSADIINKAAGVK